VTPSLLHTADTDDNPPLWQAIEHHSEVEVIELLTSLWPGAIVAVANGESLGQRFQDLPAENRVSNYDEINDLLCDTASLASSSCAAPPTL